MDRDRRRKIKRVAERDGKGKWSRGFVRGEQIREERRVRRWNVGRWRRKKERGGRIEGRERERNERLISPSAPRAENEPWDSIRVRQVKLLLEETKPLSGHPSGLSPCSPQRLQNRSGWFHPETRLPLNFSFLRCVGPIYLTLVTLHRGALHGSSRRPSPSTYSSP